MEGIPSLEEVRREKARRNLLDFVTWATPGSYRPTHLPALTDALSKSLTDPQFKTFSAPPQFGKSVVLLNGLVWFAWNRPGSVSAYITYGDAPAQAQAAKAFAIAERAGLSPKGNLHRFKLSNGSEIIFTSTDGPIESFGLTGLAIVDDPYKNPGEASSSADREFVENWFFGTLIGRIHPTTSILVVHHRWTERDLVMTLKRHGQETGLWEWTNYPALTPDGKSLWEALASTDFLLMKKSLTTTAKWEAYYMGNPRPDGGRVFGEVQTFTAVPEGKPRISIGFDHAFSSKNAADWSAYVVMARFGPKYFVLEAKRFKESAPLFEARLVALRAKYKAGPMRWYCGPSEMGHGQLLAAHALPGLQVIQAKIGKKERANPLAEAWETRPDHPGQVYVPADAPWLKDYLDEMQDFTGVPGADAHDDFVDASAAAFDALQMNVGMPGILPTNIISNWAPSAQPGGFWQRPS
jgi:predicted phage terminase large subunit-like protein